MSSICTTGSCLCNLSSQYWDGSKCLTILTYNSTCSADLGVNTNSIVCKNTLICRTNGSSCNCPSTVSVGYCDCPPRSYGAEYYWDGSYCVNALSFNRTSCLNNYMCQYLTQNTTCINDACKCLSLQYFNLNYNKCENQIDTVSSTCFQVDACRSDLGLSCQGNLCQCNASVQFWNGSMCINLFSYNQGTCTSSSQCKSGLVCILAGAASCSCGVTVSNGYCDCPARTINSEYYWNGFQCVPAASYGQACNTFNYTCQTLTQNTQCDTLAGICTCGPNTKWNDASNACVTCPSSWVYFMGSCFRLSTMNFTSWLDDIAIPNSVGNDCYGQAGAEIANGTLVKAGVQANVINSSNGFSSASYYG